MGRREGEQRASRAEAATHLTARSGSSPAPRFIAPPPLLFSRMRRGRFLLGARRQLPFAALLLILGLAIGGAGAEGGEGDAEALRLSADKAEAARVVPA